MPDAPDRDCRLYLITPPALPDLPAFADRLARALDAGDVAALQIRLKDVADDAILRAAAAILPIAQAAGVAVLMNDRMDLAKRAGCDGVHLGQGDGDPLAARKLLGAEATIGVTCHASRHLAMEAGENGADYVAFGAFFPTTTKDAQHHADPEILEWWSEMFELPCVAIGGITAGNCAPLVRAGANFLAVVGAVWNHPEGPAAGVRAMNAAIASA
ncbi:thiamine phosphate synthase [Falsiroseomonas stagni]|uniref:Thiamine-phosphate synthase n=1 Tax=Falsiroseomonas stagni DSM 19981 TaxID=1123062 RepID=A0A1I3Z616_9PROT|nr:thiamine phosphate synthase [Falsiroseomonas stagni]SFK39594.1 thiamine-phosphate pyrophosphorylase [Falsiroseomonas stagni DSM 19981]